MIQNIYSSPIPVRSAAILTTSYVAGTVIGDTKYVTTANQLQVYINFTLGSLTDCQVKIEFSSDGTNYYQETFDSISSGTNTHSLGVHKFTATGAYRLSVPIRDRYIKISAIGTGVVTSSSLQIDAILAWASFLKYDYLNWKRI